MELFKKVSRFRFMHYARFISGVSIVLTVISLGSLAVRGLNFGIDFTGGLLLEVGFERPADLPAIRQQLSDGGYPDAQVQNFGTAKDVLIRLPPQEGNADPSAGGKLGQQVLAVLQTADPQVVLRRVEFVGPQVGEDLTTQGILSVLAALVLILIYVMFRFQWKFALGAVASTAHDAIVTAGIFSIFWIPFDLTVVAAILALVGYSLNDTVVVFDRIRDNFRSTRRGTPEEVIDRSINETLSRTLITSGVTLLVVIALLIFGGETLHGFSTALVFGITFGAYSSIYVATALAYFLKVSPADLMPVKKQEQVDDLP